MLKWLVFIAVFAPFTLFAQTELIWVTVGTAQSTDTATRSNETDINDSTSALILNSLPSTYDIATVRGNNARMLKLLASESLVCAENKLLTEERKSLGYFTDIPQVVFPGLRLFINKNATQYNSVKDLVQEDGHISIKNILDTEPTAIFSIAAGRKYGESIDQLISNPKWEKRFILRHGVDMSEGVVQMLRKERADMIFEYPSVVAYYESQNNAPAILDSYALTESEDFSLGYIVCSKSPQGKAIIEQLNQAIGRLSITSKYYDAHMKFFDTQSKKDATIYYNLVYGTNF